MRETVAEMQAKLDAEDERLLEELRAALEDADQLPWGSRQFCRGQSVRSESPTSSSTRRSP